MFGIALYGPGALSIAHASLDAVDDGVPLTRRPESAPAAPRNLDFTE